MKNFALILCLLQPNLSIAGEISRMQSTYASYADCQAISKNTASMMAETILPSIGATDIKVHTHESTNGFVIQTFYSENSARILSSLICFPDGRGLTISETIE